MRQKFKKYYLYQVRYGQYILQNILILLSYARTNKLSRNMITCLKNVIQITFIFLINELKKFKSVIEEDLYCKSLTRFEKKMIEQSHYQVDGNSLRPIAQICNILNNCLNMINYNNTSLDMSILYEELLSEYEMRNSLLKKRKVIDDTYIFDEDNISSNTRSKSIKKLK
tara:strand:+ start:74 stop:580 length:507 start_codon:yes stop_codon:yes gene_type:complete